MGCLEWVLGPGQIQCLPPLLTKTAYVTTSCRDALTAKARSAEGLVRAHHRPVLRHESGRQPFAARREISVENLPHIGRVRRSPEIPSLVFVNFFRKENNLQELAILQLEHLCKTFPGVNALQG